MQFTFEKRWRWKPTRFWGTALGLLLVALGFYILRDTNRFLRDAVRTTGRIVSFAQEGGNGRDDRPVYYPIFAYEDAAGATHTARSIAGSSEWAHALGQSVPVLYNPAQPDEARIESFWTLRYGPYCFLAIGSLIAVICLFEVNGKTFIIKIPLRKKPAAAPEEPPPTYSPPPAQQPQPRAAAPRKESVRRGS